MLLAIDVGNTNICLALFEDSDLRASWRVSTAFQRTADEWFAWLLPMLAATDVRADDIDDVIISCVVPEQLSALKELCTRHLTVVPSVVGEDSVTLPLRALIDNPTEVGSDLMVNAFAAHQLYGGPLLVLDFGTATTLSLIDKEGNFCGVAIAPGLKLSLKALYLAAAKLPSIAIQMPARVIGTNTVDAMQAGVFWGYHAMVEGLITRARAENQALSDQPLSVIATGGLGKLISDTSALITTYNPDLTLTGLNLIYTQMKRVKELGKINKKQ